MSPKCLKSGTVVVAGRKQVYLCNYLYIVVHCSKITEKHTMMENFHSIHIRQVKFEDEPRYIRTWLDGAPTRLVG